MKYTITKDENLPHPSWQVGDIVVLNEGAAKRLSGSIEPYTGDKPNKHAFLEVDPLQIKPIINNG